jgi:mercuric ion transport protein
MSGTSSGMPTMRPVRPGPALVLAAFATLLASACCVLPLVLVIIGLSGAWISRMRVLEPYAPVLIGVALAALVLAAWQIFRAGARAGAACNADGSPCRLVQPSTRRWFWAVAVLALVPIVVPLMAPWFY